MVKAETDTTVQLCSCSSLTKRCKGCIFQRASLLKFLLSLHHHQCNYCYRFKNKFHELKHFLLSKIKADEGRPCYLATISTKYFNFYLRKHSKSKDTIGAAKYSCCVAAR